MKISIKATNIELTAPLKEYVEDKIGGLERLLKRVDADAIAVQVEVGRESMHHQKGDVYRAEVNIELPGSTLRAAETDWDIRVAVDSVRDKLRREIEKYLDSHGKEHKGEDPVQE